MLGFDVHGDVVAACGDKAVEEMIGPGDHEMGVEEDVVGLVDGLHEGGTEGDVVHEVAVHHIEVDPIRACGDRAAHLFIQSRPVGSEDGRGDDAGGRVSYFGMRDLSSPLVELKSAHLNPKYRRGRRWER